ncbi:hypothetical protein J6A31_05980 [bacterium]|nr:hypothetical protein [bacterium]
MANSFLYLNGVSTKFVEERKGADGRKFYAIKLPYPESADGFLRLSASEIIPIVKKDGSVSDKGVHIKLGYADTERSVTVAVMVQKNGKYVREYQKCKMSHSEIFSVANSHKAKAI